MYFDEEEENDGMVIPSLQLPGDIEIDLVPNMAAMSFLENLPLEISIETLQDMCQPMKRLVEQGRVYAVTAVTHGGGGRRCARITISANNKLYLHHLREEPPPPNACMVKHHEVMRLVDPSSRTAFLELGIGGSSVGEMQIRLLRDTQASRQFSVLCTGEMGPSYANTRFLEVWQKGGDMEYVAGGDYEMNNGSGGRAVISGLGDGDEYNRAWKAGTVWGFLLWKSIAGQFYILTKDIPGMVLSAPAFGMVEEGLEVLTEAIRCCNDIKDVFVMNCGIVLPITL